MTLIGFTVFLAGVIGTVVAFRARPAIAIAVYIAIVLLLPSWTIRPLGVFDMTAAKLVIFPLLAALVLKDHRLTGFRLNMMDAVLLVTLAGETVACAYHYSPFRSFEIQSNLASQTVLAYFAVRLGITTRDDLLILAKACAIVAVLLALHGIVETLGGPNLYDRYSWFAGGHGWGGAYPKVRYGFYRAFGPCRSPHAFGLVMCGIMPLALYLRSDPRYSRTFVAGIYGVLFLGVMSTMTSAPTYAALMITMILLMYPLKRVFLSLVAAGVTVGVFWILFYPFIEGMPSPIEVAFTGAYSQETAQYRIGLIQEAFSGGMREHWVFGFGNVGRHTTQDIVNPAFNWEHQDLVNVYINLLARFGLIAALPFTLLNVLAYVWLGRAFHLHQYESDARLIWILMALFSGWQLALMSTTILSQMITFFYVILALIAALPAIVHQRDPDWEALHPELHLPLS